MPATSRMERTTHRECESTAALAILRAVADAGFSPDKLDETSRQVLARLALVLAGGSNTLDEALFSDMHPADVSAAFAKLGGVGLVKTWRPKGHRQARFVLVVPACVSRG